MYLLKKIIIAGEINYLNRKILEQYTLKFPNNDYESIDNYDDKVSLNGLVVFGIDSFYTNFNIKLNFTLD